MLGQRTQLWDRQTLGRLGRRHWSCTAQMSQAVSRACWGHFSGRMAELPVEKATTSPQDTHFPRWWGNFIWEKRESRLGPNGFPQPHASLMIRSNIEQPHATMHCTTWTAQVTFPTSRFCQASLKLSGWNASRNHNHIMIGLRPSRFILINSRES